MALLEGACSVLEGRGILEKPLAVFWRALAVFSWYACSVLEGCGILKEALAVLEGCGTFGGRLQCFGGVLAVFWRGVAFW